MTVTSALGNYVHLTATHYNKYGITENKDQGKSVISSQATVWEGKLNALRQKISKQKTNAKDRAVQKKVEEYESIMWALQDGSYEDSEAVKNLAMQIFFSKNGYNVYKDNIQFHFGQGRVQIDGLNKDVLSVASAQQNSFLNNARELMKKGFEKKSNKTGYVELINAQRDFANPTFYRNILNTAKEIADKLPNTKTGDQILELLGPAEAAFNQILLIDDKMPVIQGDSMQIAKLPKNLTYISYAQYQELFKNFNNLLSCLSVPANSMATMSGFFLESIIEAITMHSVGAAGMTAIDGMKRAAGQSTTSTNLTFKADPDVLAAYQKMMKETKKNQKGSSDNVYSDMIKNGEFKYKSSSFQKADATINVEFEKNHQLVSEVAGLSLKSSGGLKSDIHLVSQSPLLVFILGWATHEYEANHLLNILAEHNEPNDTDAIQLNPVQDTIRTGLQLSILYSALTGQNVGKEEGFAEYLIVANRFGSKENLYAVNMRQLMTDLANNLDSGNFIKLSDGSNIANFLLPNKKVTSEATNKLNAAQRVAKMLVTLRTIKVSAAMPASYVQNNMMSRLGK